MSSFSAPKYFGALAQPPAEPAKPGAAPSAVAPTRVKLQRSRSAPVTHAEHDAYAATHPEPLARAAAPTPGLSGLLAPSGQSAPRPSTKREAATEPAHDHDAHSIAGSDVSYLTAAEGARAPASARSLSTHAGEYAEMAPGQTPDTQRLASDYRWALDLLQRRTKTARKAMPMVMQSAGMGLALAGAIHNPLLLFVAPLLLVSGAILAAPAGWALGKLLQRRAQKNPAVQNALELIRQLDAEPGALAVKAGVLANPKLAYAEAFANGGGKPFETGFRNAFVGPFKFWRKQFNETIDAVSTTLEQRKKNLAAADAKSFVSASDDLDEKKGLG